LAAFFGDGQARPQPKQQSKKYIQQIEDAPAKNRGGRTRLGVLVEVRSRVYNPVANLTQRKRMRINELLLTELDEELKKTRTALERVPADKKDFAPHAKSMPLGKLAPHVAQLAAFGLIILTTPELDFSKGSIKSLPFESTAQLLQAFDEGAAKVRAALQATPDEAWTQNWKLSFQGKTIFEGTRFLAYREMFLNHLVHHRAQLGVYLRLNDKPVPATYGPSADDTMGF
jgi:uncharacterized damage-inducible protein DinB